MVKVPKDNNLKNKDDKMKKPSFILPSGWEWHHILPISKGGSNSLENRIIVPAYLNHYLRDASYKDYVEFLSNVSKRTKKILPITDSELQKINELKTKEECHEYILEKNKVYSLLDSLLILFDNILKILPVAMLSTLPILLLTNIGSKDFNTSLLAYIYGTMLMFLFLSIVSRWYIKNKSLAIEQYLITVNKKQDEIKKIK